MRRLININGQRFGRLIAIRHISKEQWECRCDCGVLKVATSSNLRDGRTRSCGCLKRERDKNLFVSHGHCRGGTRPTEYNIWSGMITRCTNQRNHGFRYYGARGITVCDKWRASFPAFLADMGSRPSQRHSLDRIDNDGPYSPENCRWANMSEQRLNARRPINVHSTRSRFITHDGRTQTLAEWGRELGMEADLVSQRLINGWPIDKALTQQVQSPEKRPRNTDGTFQRLALR